MTKVTNENLRKAITNNMKKTLSTSFKAIAISLLFLVSGVGASVLLNPASATPNTTVAAPLAPTPLSQAEANWEYPGGNAFNQNYNPQNQINSSNAQYLGISWMYPLPEKPSALTNYGPGGVGVGMPVLIVNGTGYATTVFDETIAFNIANGNVLWTYTAPLTVNSSAAIAGAGAFGGTRVTLHSHDGNEWFTTAPIGSAITGPTLWYQGQDHVVYAINALTGKLALNFTDFTGRSMVPGDSPTSTYHSVGASNILIDQKRGILVSSIDAEISADNGRGFYAGWNLNVNPPQLKWVSFMTPPQPGGSLPLNPNWDISMVNNMSSAETFFPGKGGTNGYTTPAEVAGGVLTNTNDNIVINWKSLSPSQLNQTLYNDWGQVGQSAQCQAITGGGSTGSTGAAWGGPWVLGSGQTDGMAFVGTNNKDPFVGPCNPGPDLWSASVLALNVTNGQWIWGFQTTAHDIWDYDCSWFQALANETINGVNTEVILKTCKDGYLFEINAQTGHLIWAWDPPASIYPRCSVCYEPNPLNTTQMTADFPTAFNTWRTQPVTGAQPSFLQYPSELAGFEDEQTYNPTTNMIYAAAHIVPYYMSYLGLNASTYYTSTGETGTPINKGTCSTCNINNNNSTIFAINAQTGQEAWHYFIPQQGYRGAIENSGNIIFATLSSGDILMLNAQTGKVVRDMFIGAPMDVGVTVGSSTNGQEYVLAPVGTCSFEAVVTCPGTTPGDIVALTLQNVPTSGTGTTSTATTTVTSTAVSTTTLPGQVVTTTTTVGGQVITTTTTLPGSTVTGSATTVTTGTSGIDPNTFYGVAAVAALFIIATGYLAMRGRKPAS